MNGFLSAKINFAGVLLWLGTLACVCTASGFLGAIGWPFEITSHFRVQYAACLLALAAYFFLRKRFKTVAIFVVFATANLIVIAPYFWGPGAVEAPGGYKLRVMLLNVRTENERHDLVIDCVNKFRPDLLVLEEVNERWLNELSRLREDFPQVMEQPREDNFGIALFSRLPLSGSKILYLGGAEVPSVTAQIDVGVRRVTVLGTHPLPPGSPETFRLRNEQLDGLAKFVLCQTNPVLVLGDLNATPWSYYFQRLVRETRLTDSAKGRGIHATWPAAMFPLRIPIDHCLVSQEFRVVKRVTGYSVGSDHLPVVVDLELPSGDARIIPPVVARQNSR